jgi:hypothetical protein
LKQVLAHEELSQCAGLIADIADGLKRGLRSARRTTIERTVGGSGFADFPFLIYLSVFREWVGHISRRS